MNTSTIDTNIAFKTWPNPEDIDTIIHNTLTRLNLQNLQNEYQETKDYQDTWTITDPTTRQDLFCLIINHKLELQAPITTDHPTIDWIINEICHDLQKHPNTITSTPYTTNTYLQWCMTHRNFGPTIEMAKTRLNREKQTLKHPTLTPAYPQ